MNHVATTMKALSFAYRQDTVKIIEVERPAPTKEENEIQVKVEYAALDASFDTVLQRGWTGMFLHKLHAKPLTLGWHYAGVVTAVGGGGGGGGSNTNQDASSGGGALKVGDAVFGHLPYSPNTVAGTFAEYIVVPMDEVAKRPATVEAKVAAATTTEALTALQSLRDHGKLSSSVSTDNDTTPSKPKQQPRQSVLIIGAGGGVGSAATQIAHLMGAHVTATCSARDVERVQGYGADIVLCRDEYPDPLAAASHQIGNKDGATGKKDAKEKSKYDIILDTPVVLSPARALGYLHENGHYVTTLPSWGLVWGTLLSSLFFFLSGGGYRRHVNMVEVKSRAQDLALVAQWLDQGKLQTPIDSTFKVKDMTMAMHRQRERRKTGRVAIQVENGWN